MSGGTNNWVPSMGEFFAQNLLTDRHSWLSLVFLVFAVKELDCR